MKERKLTRRQFLQGSTALLVASAGGLDMVAHSTAANLNAIPDANSLKGFVIADTHIGWVHQDQPSLDTIREAMGRITAKTAEAQSFICLDFGRFHVQSIESLQYPLRGRFLIPDALPKDPARVS